MDIQEIKNFINKVKWTNAKTYEKSAPHEYIVRAEIPQYENEFVNFTLFIRENGYKEKFYSKEFVYYDVDNFKYWTYGDPIETTTILNRADKNKIYKKY